MSNGELYTIITNKAKKGKKGSIVGIFKGTQADDIIKIIKEKFTQEQRRMVKEVTLDMANSMNLIATKCFPKHTTVIDRFHVQKLACDAVQQKRINYWIFLIMLTPFPEADSCDVFRMTFRRMLTPLSNN